jgi:hypothetical protein
MSNPIVKTFDLIHHGTDRFNPDLFRPISNRGWIKPNGGLWTSPINSEWGWMDWCESEEFNTEMLARHVRLKFTGNTLTIDTVEDLELLPWIGIWDQDILKGIDFEFLCYSSGVQAIHLTVRGQEETRFSHPRSLYGWDCESVLVMDPACLTVVELTPTAAPMPVKRRRVISMP